MYRYAHFYHQNSMPISDQLHSSGPLPQRNSLQYQLNWRLSGPPWPVHFGEEIKYLKPSLFEAPTVQPTDQSLHW